MRHRQLEFGAEIGRAIVNFRGPIVFCVVSRYHGGAFVVFSKVLNENMEAAALEGLLTSRNWKGVLEAAEKIMAAFASMVSGADILYGNGDLDNALVLSLEQLIIDELGYKAELGIDYYFLNKAITDNKNILELETVEFQVGLLSSFSDDLMIQVLRDDVENPPTKEDFEELFSAWEEGDISKMESIVFGPLIQKPELSSYYEKMFDERNINMANQIFDFLGDDESYFVVVGAGHLVGDKGLINLMNERHYTVTQLEDMDQD